MKRTVTDNTLNPVDSAPKAKRENWQLRVVRSAADLVPYHSDWERLQHHPNTDLAFYLAFLAQRADTMTPWVVLVLEGDAIQAIVVGRIEQTTLPCKLGYWNLFSPSLKTLAIVHGGLMGEMSEGLCSRIREEFQRLLATREVDAIHAHYLPKECLLHDFFRCGGGIWCRDYAPVIVPHWRMLLPEVGCEMFPHIKSKHRSWLRRLPKVLERDFPGKIEMCVYRSADDVALLCRQAEIIAQQTYQRGLRVGFENSPETHDYLRAAARRGGLHGYVMCVESHPRAFWIAVSYGRVLHLYYTGYDPDFFRYEIGTIVLVTMFEDVRRLAPEITVVDFGFGDAPYKRKFGNVLHEEVTTYRFALAPRPVAVNLLRTIVELPHRAAKYVLERLDLESRVKRLWRLRLSRKKS